jgi:predicted transcriptional regulator
MTGRRGRLEIFLDVLKVLRRGESKPTRIMYSSNLSWKPLMHILNNFVDQEIIALTNDHGRNHYSLTRKGYEAIEYFETALDKMGERYD